MSRHLMHPWTLTVGILAIVFLDSEVGGQDTSPVVLQASSCEDLRQIFGSFQVDKRIILTTNIRCDRDNWSTPVYATHRTVLEGSRFGEGIAAVDWADSTNAIILAEEASLTFQSLVLIQDFMQLGGLKLPFATGVDGTSIELLGTGIGVRSCAQGLESLVPIYSRVPRPLGHSGQQTIAARSERLLYASDVVFIPRGRDNTTWTLCNTAVQCGVNSPFQDNFQLSLHQESLEPMCDSGRDSREIRGNQEGGSTSNGTFAAFVALFTALATTLILILVFVLFKVVVLPLILRREKKAPDPEGGDNDEESPPHAVSAASNKNSTRHSRHGSSASLLSSAVQLTEIELGVPLGKGIMGTVYKGYHNDKPLAVKVVDMEATESVVHDDDPIALYITHRRHHVNVIETFLYQTHRMEDLCTTALSTATRSFTTGASFTDTPLSSIHEAFPLETFQYRTFHVMEFCNLGTLEKMIRDGNFHSSNGQPKLLLILRTALDVAKGMQYLHSIRTVHGQLRPANILLKGDATDTRGFVCKVSDFGLTYLHERQHALELTHGRNLSFRAPETFRKGALECGSDVFAFGMILWSMLSAKIPYDRDDPAEIVSLCLEGTRPRIPETATRKYERLIKDCWHPDTAARPPFANIIERLSRIIGEVVRAQEKRDEMSSLRHPRSEQSNCSSSDLDIVGNGSGIPLPETMFDTVEIHEGSASPSSSVPFWEQFQQSTVGSPASIKSDVVPPSIDVMAENLTLRRACASWDASKSGEMTADEPAQNEPAEDNVVSKPSITVSLRYGMGSGELADSEDLSSDPSLTTK